MQKLKNMTQVTGLKRGTIGYQFLLAMGSVAILTILVTIFSGLTLKTLNDGFNEGVTHTEAMAASESMATAVQYNMANINAFRLGHLEHENEFVKHRATFINNLKEFETIIATTPSLLKLADQANRLKRVRESYDAASFVLFSTHREWTTLNNKVDSAWTEIEDRSHELSDVINTFVTAYADDPALTESVLSLVTTVEGSARNVNAYLLGHSEHRQKFVEQNEQVAQTLANAKQQNNDPAWQAQLVELEEMWTAYDEGSHALFDMFDAQVILQNQSNQQWETTNNLGNDLNRLTVEVRDIVEREQDAAQIIIKNRFRTALIILGLVAGLVLVLSIGLALFISGKINRSLQIMIDAATNIAEGDLSQRIEVSSYDELARLAHAFNQMITYLQEMAEAASSIAQGDMRVSVLPQSEQDELGTAFSRMTLNLSKLIGQVQQSSRQVAGSSEQLDTAIQQVGQASQQVTLTIQQIAEGNAQQTQALTGAVHSVEQIANAAKGIARGAQEQAHAVQQSADLIQEMDNLVDQVSQATTSVTAATTQATQTAHHGVTAIKQTSAGMETIRTSTLTTAKKVREMNAHSKEIGRIVDTIDNIADKTDMLALNAAVEAARAGEHGRGFAVVADQVRKLSEDSKGATHDIDNLITEVQETINEAIAAMDNTVIEVDHGTRLAGDTAQSLQDILGVVEKAATVALTINEAVIKLKQKSEGVVAVSASVGVVVEENTAVAEEMAANTQEVTSAVEGVASIAEENGAATEEVSASAEEMLAQIEETAASTKDLADLADQLRTAVAQFQIAEGDQPN